MCLETTFLKLALFLPSDIRVATQLAYFETASLYYWTPKGV